MISDLPGVAAYLHDLIVTGQTEESHLKNLDALLQRLHDYGLCVKLEKCEFFKESLEYLGHIIDKNGKRPSDSSIEAIKQLPRPTIVKNCKRSWGKLIITVNLFLSCPIKQRRCTLCSRKKRLSSGAMQASVHFSTSKTQ